jgi:hypothetical protein
VPSAIAVPRWLYIVLTYAIIQVSVAVAYVMFWENLPTPPTHYIVIQSNGIFQAECIVWNYD